MSRPKSWLETGLGVVLQRRNQQVAVEDVDAHRREAPARAPGDLGRRLRLLAEGQHPRVRVDLEHPVAGRVGERHLERADREPRAARDVDVEHPGIVHLVDVVARQHDRPARVLALDRVQVLPHGVGRAEVPVLAHALLRRVDLDELSELAVDDVPAHPHVAVEALRLVLGRDEDLAQAGVDAVREREVDDPIGTAERDGRLGALARERVEPLAGATREQDRDHVPEHQDVHERSYRPLRQARERRTTRAGAPSPPPTRKGRHAMSYSPGSTSERSSPSTTITPAPSSAWCAGKFECGEPVDREVVEAHELETRLCQVERGVLAQVEVVLLVAAAEQLPRHARLEQHAQVVAQVERLEIGALDALARQDLHDPGLAHQDLERERVDRRPTRDEVGGRVHVGPRMGGEPEAREAVGHPRPPASRSRSTAEGRRGTRPTPV